MSIKKKGIIISVFALLLALSSTLGISAAYLAKSIESRANNFTFSNASIDLVEEKWDKLTPEDKIVYPEKRVIKDPKIINTGENDIYVYLEIQIPRANIRTVNKDEMVNEASWQNLLTFEVNSGWELIDSYASDDERFYIELYAYTKCVLSPSEETNTLFDNVTFVNMLEGEIRKGSEFEMPIAAYAIQSDYLDTPQGSTVKDIMSEAFESYKAEEAKR